MGLTVFRPAEERFCLETDKSLFYFLRSRVWSIPPVIWLTSFFWELEKKIPWQGTFFFENLRARTLCVRIRYNTRLGNYLGFPLGFLTLGSAQHSCWTWIGTWLDIISSRAGLDWSLLDVGQLSDLHASLRCVDIKSNSWVRNFDFIRTIIFVGFSLTTSNRNSRNLSIFLDWKNHLTTHFVERLPFSASSNSKKHAFASWSEQLMSLLVITMLKLTLSLIVDLTHSILVDETRSNIRREKASVLSDSLVKFFFISRWGFGFEEFNPLGLVGTFRLTPSPKGENPCHSIKLHGWRRWSRKNFYLSQNLLIQFCDSGLMIPKSNLYDGPKSDDP